MISNRLIYSKDKAFLQQWKGSKEDLRKDIKRFMESFRLAEFFMDIQTVNDFLSMRQDWDKYLSR